jgi:hypothetical protein
MTYSGPVHDAEPRRQTTYVDRSVKVAKAGVSFGSTLAIVISWSANHSILWAIIDGFLSWAYVVYYALTR